MKKLSFLLLTLISISAFAQTYNYTTYDVSNSGIGSNYIGDIKVDANGLLWMATYNGVSTFNGTTFTNYSTSNSGIASNAIIKIEIDGLGRKWIASQNNGIILFNGTTWTNYTTSNSGLPNNAINDIAVDGLNNLWVATAAGLSKFNGTTWTTYNALTNLNTIATDNSNGVWVTNNFNVLYKFNGTDYDVVFQGVSKILKIANDKVYCDSGDGLMTFTTSGTLLGIQYQSNSCLSGYQFNALDVDSNNNVWIGFNGTGLQNFTNCTSYTTANSGLPDNYFSTLRTEASGTIWLGTLQLGLVKMTPSTETCNPPTNFSSTNITSTSATINWNAATPTPTNYLFVYNTEQTVGGIDGNTTSTSANLTELSPNTDYHWWIASVCGSELTEWVYGGYFTTLQGTTPSCFKEISSGNQFTIAIKEDGSLWSWGQNTIGQLGYPETGNINVPTQIGTNTNWKSISCGLAHTIAIKEDGSLWAWGNNLYGYIGDGTTAPKNTPIQIGTATNWQKVAAGSTHSIAIKTDGTLWAWGDNSDGQLGDGTTTNKTVPTQIGTATNWQNVGAGNSHSLGIKTNGTLWTWGRNNKGQLGDGTLIDKSIAIQIGTETDWQQIDGGISYSVAIRGNGTLWTWGDNISGQLGHNDVVTRTVPTKVGTATTWELVSAGTAHVVASRTYGALFAWGNNGYGQLGNGTTSDNDVLAPTLLFNEDGWTAVNAGFDFSTALSNDGNVFTWGNNSLGQLGNGTNIDDNEAYGSIACPTTTLSVGDITNGDSLKVYPNPVAQALNVSYNENITSLSIYNILGQEIISKAINANEGTIDASNLPSGTYIVKVTADNLVKTIKVIKQ